MNKVKPSRIILKAFFIYITWTVHTCIIGPAIRHSLVDEQTEINAGNYYTQDEKLFTSKSITVHKGHILLAEAMKCSDLICHGDSWPLNTKNFAPEKKNWYKVYDNWVVILGNVCEINNLYRN